MVCLGRSISCVLEIVGAFAGSEGVEETAYAPPEAIDGALFGFSEKCLEFCEDLLDWIEVRRVRRQKQEMGASSANGAADRAAFVRAEVIHDNDVAGAQHRSEHVFDISLETFAVDWTVEDARRIDASTAQGGHKGQGFPMAVRNLGMEPFAAPAPSPKWRHIGLCPSLVEKDETLGCKPCLKTLPYGPPASDIRTLLLAGRDAFF